MKVNTPLGIMNFSDHLKNYGFCDVDESKPLKKLAVQTFEGGKEVLWFNDEAHRPTTRISMKKNQPLNYHYQCTCGYELKSSFNLPHIRCHECEELMTKGEITYQNVI